MNEIDHRLHVELFYISIPKFWGLIIRYAYFLKLNICVEFITFALNFVFQLNSKPNSNILFPTSEKVCIITIQIKGAVRQKIFYCRSTLHMREYSVLTKSIYYHVSEIFRVL